MAKTRTIEIEDRAGEIPVLVYIEDLPFGKILRSLHSTQGVTDIRPLLGEGGTRSPLTPEEIQASQPINLKAAIATALAQGPRKPAQLADALGRKATTIYTALTALKKAGIAENANGDGWRLTPQAMAAAKGHSNGQHATPGAIALPSPAQVARGPKGRASTGEGPRLLLAALAAEGKTPAQLKQVLAAGGMSDKSISGVLDRARKHGIVKRDPKTHVYELTARGRQQRQAEASEVGAHG